MAAAGGAVMNPLEEIRDLKANPLPSVVIIDPLTEVWCLEGQIAALQEEISRLMEKRTEALNYAVQNRIVEDELHRLDMKVRKTRTLDVARFRAVFPEEYMMACDIERKEKEEALNHLGERINLTLVDRLVKKPVLEAAPGVVTVRESVTYVVVRKV
jgi:uncharacterized small protein (DUF1192 family)